MPTVSIYLSDDIADYLAEQIGKGEVSPYVQSLIEKDKGRVRYLKDKETFDWVLNFSLLLVGLSFIFITVGQNIFPGILGSFGYVVVLLSGGVLLIMQSTWKISNGHKQVKKYGTNTPVIR